MSYFVEILPISLFIWPLNNFVHGSLLESSIYALDTSVVIGPQLHLMSGLEKIVYI